VSPCVRACVRACVSEWGLDVFCSILLQDTVYQ
jgi:hypothetical protein